MGQLLCRKRYVPSQQVARSVIGIGNPYSSYRLTRHNVGKQLVDYLNTRLGRESTRISSCQFSYVDATLLA